MVTKLDEWVGGVSGGLQDSASNGGGGGGQRGGSFDTSAKKLTGEQSVPVLENIGITRTTLPMYQELLDALRKPPPSDDVPESSAQQPELSTRSVNLLQGLLLSLDLLLGNMG